MDVGREEAKVGFIARALDDLAPYFVARTFGDEQPENTREHSSMLIFEELCSLFEDAGLAKGIWSASGEGPRPGQAKVQPPFYRLLVWPEDTRAFLVAHPVPGDITVGRTATLWGQLFEEWWSFADDSRLPRPDRSRWLPMADGYRAQIERLALLGFVRIEGDGFLWHPWCCDRYENFRRVYAYDVLSWPEDEMAEVRAT